MDSAEVEFSTLETEGVEVLDAVVSEVETPNMGVTVISFKLFSSFMELLFRNSGAVSIAALTEQNNRQNKVTVNVFILITMVILRPIKLFEKKCHLASS